LYIPVYIYVTNSILSQSHDINVAEKLSLVVVFNATFNNISVISWRSVLLVEETGGPGENHRPVASHWQPLSHNVVHLALFKIRTHNSGDRHWLHRKNYHTITVTTVDLDQIKSYAYITGRWFSPGPPVSSTNKTDRHDITEILLKVALNTIKQTNNTQYNILIVYHVNCE
jgi:hypothetical protein